MTSGDTVIADIIKEEDQKVIKWIDNALNNPLQNETHYILHAQEPGNFGLLCGFEGSPAEGNILKTAIRQEQVTCPLCAKLLNDQNHQ